MAKNRRHTYRFNPHTLRYEKVIVSLHDRIKKISFSVLSGVVVGVLGTMLALLFIDSPKEKRLKAEVSDYRRQLTQLNLHVTRAEHILADFEQRDDALYRVIFGAEPIRDSIPFIPLSEASNHPDRLLALTTARVDTLCNRVLAQSFSMDEVYEMARTKQERMATMPAIMPISKTQCQIVSGFGLRYHPILHYTRMHTGIDLSAHRGVPIYATGDGVVEFAGSSSSTYSGYGVVCVINHGYGFKTLYAHMGQVLVRNGQRVRRGEQIGIVGTSGLSQGPHLHYEVIQNGKKVDPVYFFFNDLTPSEYEQVIELAKQENQCLS